MGVRQGKGFQRAKKKLSSKLASLADLEADLEPAYA
jgi:hypothetical protein